MKGPATLLEKAPVRDLVSERVLEGKLEIRIELRLAYELGGLQAVESLTECFFRKLRDRLQQSPRHVLADNGAHVQEALVVRGEAVDARRQHHLDGGRDLDGVNRLRQPILATLAIQRLRLLQRPDRLLQEEWIPALDQE